LDISVFGLGYVGSVGLGCLAQLGHKVIGVDTNTSKVSVINQGKSPVVEAGLDEIIALQRERGMISATQDVGYAVAQSNVSFICVGTPPTFHGHLNFDAVWKVAHDLGKALKVKKHFHVVALRSTVLPGTCEKVANIIREASGGVVDEDFSVVSNPEFLREGTAVDDYYHPPYTLVGSSCDRAIDTMKKVYGEIKAPVITSDIRVAELTKCVNNSFHALKITFTNEIGSICKRLGIDSHELMRIFCMDTRLNISPYYMKPGFAYGGSCLPKDVKALHTAAHDLYLRCPVIESIEVSNELHKELVLSQILAFGKQKIGVLGLSFKTGTDDLRNSPIIDVLEKLLGKGFDVRVYDKNIQLSQLIGANREFILQRIPLISRFMAEDLTALLSHAEVLVIVNKEEEFESALKHVRPETVIYDLVNIGVEGRCESKNYVGLSW
jgi:GDP-mannose 6-dehydrogenase